MKPITNRLFAPLAVLVASLPLLAMASPASALSVAGQTPFCANLPTTISTINSNIASLTGKLNTAQSSRLSTLNDRWAKADQTLTTSRAGWAAARQTQFAKLEAKATTDAQKAAVTTFESTITTAINTRESANDAARATYRSGVTSLVNTKQSTTNGQVTTFTDAVNAAEAAATAGCQSSPSSATNRTTFQAALKSARTTYSGDRTGDSNIATQVKALAQTRDAAIAANDATFKAAASAAETALKAAFSS
ncbi:MAG TPA: hypothetical protein VMT23_03760 [Candidatus Binatia bacterium]|nr:hypothetical protein [Candidatus Binatia bacterium]